MVLMVMVLCYWTIDELDACHSMETVESTECNEGITPFPSDWQEFFKTVPIFIFAYECHTNLWPIRNEIQNPTLSRLTSVGVNTAIFCTAIYAVIGFAGYLTYGENVEGNILNNYPQTTTIGILRVALSFAITFSYPLVSYPARECFSTLLFGKSPDDLKWYTYYGITYVMAVGSVVAAIIADDLELVLGLLGSTGAVAITFVMPGLFYFYLGDHPVLRKSKWHGFKRKSAVCLVVFGIVMAVVGVALQFDG